MNNHIQQELEFKTICDTISHLISELPWYLEPDNSAIERCFIDPSQGSNLSQVIKFIVHDAVKTNYAVVEVVTNENIINLYPVEPEYLLLDPGWTSRSSKDECRWIYSRDGNTKIRLTDRQVAFFPIDGNFELTAEQLKQDTFHRVMQPLYKTRQDLVDNLHPSSGEDLKTLQRLINTGNEMDGSIVAIAQMIGNGVNRMLNNLDITTIFKFGFRNESEFAHWSKRHKIAQLKFSQTKLFLGLELNE